MVKNNNKIWFCFIFFSSCILFIILYFDKIVS
jgi:hypothetical protein